MPEDNQAIENRNKGQDGESARQEFTIAQRKKRERHDPRDYIPSSLDGEEITVTLIKQLAHRIVGRIMPDRKVRARR
jgi:predicted nucleotidyltransferase component of viral defense system